MSQNNEIITPTTQPVKAYSILLDTIHKFLNNESPKQIPCTTNLKQIKDYHEKYKFIIKEISALKHNDKTDRTTKDKPTHDKRTLTSSKIYEENNIKHKSGILQSVIDCLDPESEKTDLGTKIVFESDELFKKVHRIMDLKLTALKADNSLKPFRGGTKTKIQKWSDRLSQPLENLLASNQTLAKETKQLKQNSQTILQILSILNQGNFSTFEKHIKNIEPNNVTQLAKLKSIIQIHSKSPNHIAQQFHATSRKRELVDKLQRTKNLNQQLTQHINSILSQQELSAYCSKQSQSESLEETSRLRTDSSLKKHPALNDLFMVQQHFKQEEAKNQKYRKAFIERNKQFILAFIENEAKLKNEIQSLKQNLAQLQQQKQKSDLALSPQQKQNTNLSTADKHQSNAEANSTSKQHNVDQEFSLVKEQLIKVQHQKVLLNQQIKDLQTTYNQNKTAILLHQQQTKQLNQLIQKLNKQNSQHLHTIRQLQTQLLHPQHSQNQKQQPRPNRHIQKPNLFDENSWLSISEQTKQAAQIFIKEIQKLQTRPITHINLLYRYSPSNKLQWSHFVNRSNVIFLIKTANNKLIAVYSLAPLLKPSSPNQTSSQQKAFIFQSSLTGNNPNVYPLLPGKKFNGSHSNIIAFGKSDLKFTITENILQGNFGYNGCSFDSKKKKITDLLGGTKVKMLAFQIYTVHFYPELQKTRFTDPKDRVKTQTGIERQKSSLNIDHHKQIRQLKEYVDKQTQQIQSKTELINQLNEKYQTSKTRQINLDQQNQLLKQEIKSLQQKVDTELKQLTQSLAQKQNADSQQITELRLQLQTFKTKILPQKEETITAAKHEIEQLKSQLNQLKVKIIKLNLLNKQVTAKLAEKQSPLNSQTASP